MPFRRPRPQVPAARCAPRQPGRVGPFDDVTPLGGIQVPSGLEPIAMGVDFPSIGGYAKIATVISAHLRRLGQARPGDPVRFQALSVEDAVGELRRSLDAVTPRVLSTNQESAA
jgi:allophanate hydrolase subunit 2